MWRCTHPILTLALVGTALGDLAKNTHKATDVNAEPIHDNDPPNLLSDALPTCLTMTLGSGRRIERGWGWRYTMRALHRCIVAPWYRGIVASRHRVFMYHTINAIMHPHTTHHAPHTIHHNHLHLHLHLGKCRSFSDERPEIGYMRPSRKR